MKHRFIALVAAAIAVSGALFAQHSKCALRLVSGLPMDRFQN